MKIGATVQARMGSSRLPGKVLKQVLGRPLLELQIERIRRSILIDEVVIATTTLAQDDPIEELAVAMGVKCFRGSEDDVLGRVADAVRAFDIDIHVEFMGDNPIPDPLLVDAAIGFYLKHADVCDYVTNALKTTYPPGTEVMVYAARTLFDAEARTVGSLLREHVGSNIYLHPERYRICNLEAPPWLRAPDLHLEVDTQVDFEVVAAVYEQLYPGNPGFGLQQVIDFMRANPELSARNRDVPRRWRRFRNDEQ